MNSLRDKFNSLSTKRQEKINLRIKELMINEEDFSKLTTNYIDSCNKLLNIICEIEDYMQFKLIFNKDYISSLETLIEDYINIKGSMPYAVILSKEDINRFNSEANLYGYVDLTEYIFKRLCITSKIFTRENAISNYLANK